MEAYSEIAVNELGVKCRSKKEVYNLLCSEGGIYLPPIKDANHKYISQIIVADNKQKCKDVKVCTIPHYDQLRISDLLRFARSHIDIESYLPDYEYNKYPNRQWLCNVLNMLLGSTLTKYIEQSIENRVKYVVNQKKLTVKALPEFINIFVRSKNISIEKGRTNHLIKRFGKRKWDEIESTDKDKLREANKACEQFQSEIYQLEEKILKFQQTQDDLLDHKVKLCKLYEAGYIDSDGEIIES